MKPQDSIIEVTLTFEPKDAPLYNELRDTPIKKRAMLIIKYIKEGLSADYNEHYLKQRIQYGISTEIMRLTSIKGNKSHELE